MKKSFIILLAIVAISSVAGSLYIYKHTTADLNSKHAVTTVIISPVIQKDVKVEIQALGTVQALNTVDIKSRVDGQLLSVDFNEGDSVHKSDILFTIDPKPFQVALQQAQAKLASDQARLENAKLVLQRNAPLSKKGYVSTQELDQFKTNSESIAGEVEADKAAIAAAQLQLDYTVIRSPLNGRTGNVFVNEGNLIKANDTTPLVTINQMQPIYVSFAVPEQYLATIRNELKQKPITVTALINEHKAETTTGILSFINNTVDSTTGTIALKATFPNKDEKLWPGQYVTITLPTHSYAKALLIPTQAIQINQQNNAYVFVLQQDSHVALRLIKAKNHAIGDNSIITEGLQAGEHVVTTGQMHLVDGAKVNVAK